MSSQATSGNMDKELVPKLTIDKPVAMMDEQIQICIQQLYPFQEITVVGRIIERNVQYISHAHFIADNSGVVNLTYHASLGGSYMGIDGMGLIWSMMPSLENKKGSRLTKRNVTTPHLVQVAVVSGHQTLQSWGDLKIKLCETTIERWYLASDTERLQLKHGRLRGTMFTPKKGGKRAGIIDLFGTAGGLVELRASLLASYGFTVLALAYFDYDDLPKGIEFDLDYFDEAIDFMWSNPRVDNTEGLGVIGVSKGGEMALHMASFNRKIKVCISINAGHYYSFGIHTYKDKEIKLHFHDTSEIIYSDEGLICRNAHAVKGDCDIIPVEKSKAHFLLLQGGDDQAIFPENALTLAKRILDSGNKNAVLKIYPRAGHLLEPPYTPLCKSVYHKFLDDYVMYGGEPRFHAVAQQQSWEDILHFLGKHFQNNYARIGRIPLSNL